MIRINNELKTKLEVQLAEHNRRVGHNYVPPMNEFRLSSATECPRKAYYNKVILSSVDNNLMRIFLIGQVLHQLMQDTVFKNYENEVEVKSKYGKINLIGHCDVLAPDRVIELKTCSYLPKEPYANHILQVNAYAKLLYRDTVSIIYIEKNKLNLRVFDLDFDEDLYCMLCENFHAAYDGIENDELPYAVECSECRYCPYKQLCRYNLRG